MSRRLRRRLSAPAWITVLIAAMFVSADAITAAPAGAAYYKMLICAGNVGAGEYTTETNTTSGTSPGGIFALEDHCGPAGNPAGNAAYLRIAENQGSGAAGQGAYGRFVWTAPEGISIATAGGYTREPNSFNEGWRARYWLEGFDGSENNVLVQGSGITEPTEVNKPKTTTFAPHLWPFTALGDYRKFSFEMTCIRTPGCDRSNYNAVDSNSMELTLDDPSPPTVTVAEGPLANGEWVKGSQPISWSTNEAGSGLRFERLRVDGAEKWTDDYRSSCDIDASEASGEYARSFEPCPTGGPFPRTQSVDTAALTDGTHTVSACAQDLAQAEGAFGTAGESCVSRTIHTDNTAPSAPLSLSIGSVNSARYEQTFSANWQLPTDTGSPITKVIYWVTDAGSNLVVPQQVISAVNPTALPEVTGPSSAGAYTLHVALEDAVGFVGPASTAAIPHDTTPPAAPQDLSVTSPTAARSTKGFDVQWTDIVDSGSPISAAHYEVTDTVGNVVVGEQTIAGENISAITDLATPAERGIYLLKVWLSDGEGNVGAPVSAPLAYGCGRSDVKGGVSLSATFGAAQRNQILVPYGSGATLGGTLRGTGGTGLAGAPVCVWTRVVTGHKKRFLGVAITDAEGRYSYPLPAGASREVLVENRPGQRTVRSRATLVTKARPTLELVSRTPIHNGHTATFRGKLPGPDSGEVLLDLQVKSGHEYIVFRRFETRPDGSFEVKYPFTQSFTPRTYAIRAEMRRQKGVPYHAGASELVYVPVRPSRG